MYYGIIEITAPGRGFEPEVNIHSATKAEAEDMLEAEISRHLDSLSDGVDVMLKLTLPSKAGLYGFIVNYNRASAEFIMRKPGHVYLSRTKNVLRFTEQRVKTDRAVRYYFVNSPRADYASLAARYRAYLMAVSIPSEPELQK